jgi:hypothetical protein
MRGTRTSARIKRFSFLGVKTSGGELGMVMFFTEGHGTFPILNRQKMHRLRGFGYHRRVLNLIVTIWFM